MVALVIARTLHFESPLARLALPPQMGFHLSFNRMVCDLGLRALLVHAGSPYKLEFVMSNNFPVALILNCSHTRPATFVGHF